MSKIPTASEFIKSKIETGDAGSTRLMLIEFAKLHVEAAIKECIQSAPSGGTDQVYYEDVVESLKDCYPKTNIK